MKAGRNRPGRKDQSRDGHARNGCSRRHALAALATGLALVFAVAPAQAETGGVSAVTTDIARTSSGAGFTPMRSAGATWYGPGFYGNRTACGQTLRPQTIGVAHRSLPCGTPVRFAYRGRAVIVPVIDRGPYARGYSWDLTNGARLALDFEGSGRIRYAIGLGFARR